MSNIRPGWYIDIHYNQKFLPNEYFEKYKNWSLNDWDVVIAMTDMASDPKILAVPTLIETKWKKLLLNQRVWRFYDINKNRLLTPYLRWVLLLETVRDSIKWLWAHNVQINLSKHDILNIQIPLPSLEIQAQIVELMDRAIETKKRLELEADEMLTGIDDWLLAELGIEKWEKNEKKVFVVNVNKILWNPLSAEFYIEKKKSDYISKPIKELSSINPSRNFSIDKNGVVPYVWLPETSDWVVNEVNIRPFKEVGARNIIQKWDILFARIEPSIFNKKYILVDDLKGYNFALTSTEFYVLESYKEIVNNQYLYYLLFSNPVYTQFAGKTTGSTGRRRLDRQVFENIQIPLPPLSEQERIAEHISAIIDTARVNREEAQRVYGEARKEVERRIIW